MRVLSRLPIPGLQSWARSDAGQSLVLFALLLVPLIGGAGLAIDYGQGASEQRRAQSAADASALAGAIDLPSYPGSLNGNAVNVATQNGYTHGAANTTVTVASPPTTGAHVGDPKSVEVTITRSVPTRFMTVLGQTSMAVTARSVATASGGAFPCGIYVLDPTQADALNAAGNGTISVNGGCIQVNSNSLSAGHVNGNAVIASGGTNVVGGCVVSGGAGAAFAPPCTIGQPPSIDPLMQVPVPSGTPASSSQFGCSGTPPSCSISNGNRTLTPGVYNNISLSGNSSVVLNLNPGVYIITGQLSHTGQGALLGSGVTLYFACPRATSPYYQPCTSGQSGGGMSIGGQGDFQLAAPTSGPYQGLLLFSDRNNTAPISLAGNGGLASTGTIYAKSATVNITGNGSTYNSLIVADSMNVSGNGNTIINYDPANNYPTQQPGQARLTE